MIVEAITVAVLWFSGLKKTESLVEGEYIPRDAPLPPPAKSPATVPAVPAQTGALQPSNAQKAAMIRKINVAATAALGLALLGLVYWPLNLLSAGFLLYAAKNFLVTVFYELKQFKFTVNTLLAIVLLNTFFIPYGFLLASIIIALYVWSIKLTDRLTAKSRQEIANIFEKTPEYVWLVVDNAEVKIPYAQIRPGDVLVVHPGNPIPADGVIIEGMATVDQHVLTGESRPVEREVGDKVFSSTILLSGKIYLQVEAAGAETTVAKITNILNTTVDFKTTVQMRSERLSQSLVMPALLGGVVALPFIGYNGALAVINSHPKEKMAVVGPIGILNFLKIALENKILIKDGRALELLNTVDTIVFDKTGTLTEERPVIGTIHCADGRYPNEILAYAAAAEYKQTHPLAKAILHEAEQRGIQLPPIEETHYTLGYGVAVRIGQQSLHVGSARFMQKEQMNIPDFLREQQEHSQEQGYTLIMVAVDGQVCGGIELLPKIREETWQIIHYLKQRGKKTCIISGDHHTPTRNLARLLEIDEYFAEVLPQEKAAIIKKLQAQGRSLCYVGDGINDSIALRQAQVAVSLSGASSIAIDTAEIVLLDKGLSHLPLLFDLADRYRRNLNVTFSIMLVPAAIGVGGAFLLHFGLAQTIVLNMLGLGGGIINAMLPALTDKSPPKP